MVKATITDANQNKHLLVGDKIDIKGDMVYFYTDKYKDNELAQTENLQLDFVVKFVFMNIVEIREDED